MYLNQQIDRNDVLDFKQAIGAGNTMSLSRPQSQDTSDKSSQSQVAACSAKPAIAPCCAAIN
jgi:hypothetical protein